MLNLPTAFLKFSGEPLGSVFTLSLTLLEDILLTPGVLISAETGCISIFPDFSGKITNVAITCEEYSPSVFSISCFL